MFLRRRFAKRPRYYHKLINRSEITDTITKQFAMQFINRPRYHINLKRDRQQSTDEYHYELI